jgi:hypothetical protein
MNRIEHKSANLADPANRHRQTNRRGFMLAVRGRARRQRD